MGFGTSLLLVYLRNPPHKPLWSRSQPEPRAACAVPGRGHVAQMDELGSPWGHMPIPPPQPWVTDSRANQAAPATGLTARNDNHMSVTAASSILCILNLFGPKTIWCVKISRIKNKLCVVILSGKFSPFALTADFSLLSSIFQSRFLLKKGHTLCGVSHSNTRRNFQMSCKIIKQRNQFICLNVNVWLLVTFFYTGFHSIESQNDTTSIVKRE